MEASPGGHKWTDIESCEKAWAATQTSSGVYKWFLQGDLPKDFNWPPALAPIRQGGLIYIGRAKSLRTRAKHHRLPSSQSTLRRALASLMGLQAEWRGNSAHPGLIREHELQLSSWMTNNLAMSFDSCSGFTSGNH
ncbi:GIY-YIG nuclease family protein [Arthrobacter sp. SLBN-100]|uniref:GIY-YIG nuclease family protein n=1 Tax=Arthrobacter sp. SLBN-100 TaxID=2768450 RepID=UPI003FA47E7E